MQFHRQVGLVHAAQGFILPALCRLAGARDEPSASPSPPPPTSSGPDPATDLRRVDQACLLSIRHNLEASAADFAAAEVRRFDRSPVRIGRGPGCECRVDAAGFAEQQVCLHHDPTVHHWRVTPEPGTPTPAFLNGALLRGTGDLRSGDEIRIGHWTFRFQCVRAPAGRARSADLMAFFTKSLLAAILLTEVAVVAWLPRQVEAAKALEFEAAQRRTLMLLDRSRKTARSTKVDSDLAKSAIDLVLGELDTIARFVRTHEDQLGRDQWRLIYEDLVEYETILARVAAGAAFLPAPSLDADRAVRLLTQRQGPLSPGHP